MATVANTEMLSAFAVRHEAGVDVTVRVEAPEAGVARVATDMVAVLDVSGSMASEASIRNGKGERESHGLSLLDVVRHAAKTMVHTLGPEDRLAIVAFNHAARVALPLRPMDAQGTRVAQTALQQMQPKGGTDIWRGLRAALEIMENREDQTRPLQVCLLTDGRPMTSPPRGEVNQLRRHLDVSSLPSAMFRLYTFGFGYEINSMMLAQLARVGNGAYAFIPDAGMVGTVLVHALAASLTAVPCASDAHVTVTMPKTPASAHVRLLAPLVSGAELTSEAGCGQQLVLPVPGLGYGQAREVQFRLESPVDGEPKAQLGQDIVLELRIMTGRNASAVAEAVSSADAPEAQWTDTTDRLSATVNGLVLSVTSESVPATPNVISLDMTQVPEGPEGLLISHIEDDAAALSTSAALCARGRLLFVRHIGVMSSMVDQLRELSRADTMASLEGEVLTLEASLEGFRALAESLGHTEAVAYLNDLLSDATGQVREAIAGAEPLDRWGRHFLLSLARAHEVQSCNNFKDPGVQHYGGHLFRALRDDVDDIYNDLPPPQPTLVDLSLSNRPGCSTTSRGSLASPMRHVTRGMGIPAVTSMRLYNSRGNACFHGDCVVERKHVGGKALPKKISEVRRGDLLLTGSGKYAPVRCVVKTLSRSGCFELVTFPASGLKVTPWHPVLSYENAGCGKGPQWVFPISVMEAKVTSCEAVYSILFEKETYGANWAGDSVVVNGIIGAALGHGHDDNDVIAHPFFGKYEAVDQELVGLPGYSQGCVTFREGACRRNPWTDTICGFDKGFCVDEDYMETE